jgi:hypothetical protein
MKILNFDSNSNSIRIIKNKEIYDNKEIDYHIEDIYYYIEDSYLEYDYFIYKSSFINNMKDENIKEFNIFIYDLYLELNHFYKIYKNDLKNLSYRFDNRDKVINYLIHHFIESEFMKSINIDLYKIDIKYFKYLIINSDYFAFKEYIRYLRYYIE